MAMMGYVMAQNSYALLSTAQAAVVEGWQQVTMVGGGRSCCGGGLLSHGHAACAACAGVLCANDSSTLLLGPVTHHCRQLSSCHAQLPSLRVLRCMYAAWQAQGQQVMAHHTTQALCSSPGTHGTAADTTQA
jgi:hypothetical protein